MGHNTHSDYHRIPGDMKTSIFIISYYAVRNPYGRDWHPLHRLERNSLDIDQIIVVFKIWESVRTNNMV